MNESFRGEGYSLANPHSRETFAVPGPPRLPSPRRVFKGEAITMEKQVRILVEVTETEAEKEVKEYIPEGKSVSQEE